MDGSNWRSSPQESAATDGGGDWRAQLQPEIRHRLIDQIVDILRHFQCAYTDGTLEFKKIAEACEAKHYYAASSQSDYTRRMALKILTLKSKCEANNSMGMTNLQDPASQNMQSQDPGTCPQQLMIENLQNTIASAGVQSPASSSSTLQPGNGLSHNSMPNVVQNSNLQNSSGISQSNLRGNALVQGPTSNLSTHPQKQIQGRQVDNSQQQLQQTQNAQQGIYQQPRHLHILKQNLNQNTQQSLVQPQTQQQQTTQLQNNFAQSSQSQVMPNSFLMQHSMVSGLPQNQQSPSMRKASQSVVQQHQQPALRQQPGQQTQQGSVIHHRPTHLSQQAMLPKKQQLPQQHHLMGRQSTVLNMRPNQLIHPQNIIPDMQHQHQRLLGQQSTLSDLSGQLQNTSPNLQQQMMGQQKYLSNMHRQQINSQGHVGTLPSQQKVLRGQSNSSAMPMPQYPLHMMQQPKALALPQNPNAPGLSHGGGQQLHAQQQMIPEVQPQTAQQLQQKLDLQQQQDRLHNSTQQQLQSPNTLLHQQNLMDQQKMFERPPAEAPSTSLDSTAQTGNSGDWQEEVYQKIRVMKDAYFADLKELYQTITMKLQQHDSVPQQTKIELPERLRKYKDMFGQALHYLQMSKMNILPQHKEKLPAYEKLIPSLLQRRPRKMQQSQIPGAMHSHQPQSQIPQSQSHESGMNPQMQSINAQGSISAVPPSNSSNFHGPGPSSSAISSSQQNIMSSLQPSSNLDPGLNPSNSDSQQVSIGYVQQNPQQGNIKSLQSQGGVTNLLNASINPLHSNPYMLQSQHLKPQDQQRLQSQQPKQQMHCRQIHQQMLLKQELMQQQQHQQQLHQVKQELPEQMQGHQMTQLHQVNDGNDLKIRHGMNLKPPYPQQQQKPGASFPISSSAMSSQINQHSPQIDQQNALPPLIKVGTPLQSTNSPSVVPSPSTPMAPSPLAGGETEKPSTVAPLPLNTSVITHQQTTAPTFTPSLAIGTPGISASPLLAELSTPDGNQANAIAIVSGKSSVTEDPLDRLLKAVKSVSSKVLSTSVSGISSVVTVSEQIAGSTPGSSRAAVGEDLVATTKCRLQARNCITQDGNGLKRMRRCISVMPSEVSSFLDSHTDSFGQVTGFEVPELESTATSSVKRPRLEVNLALVAEIKEINDRLIDTVVAISDEDVDPTVAAKVGEGIIVKCSYIAVSMSPSLKAQYAQMSPIRPLRLLVPANYPNCSPVMLDKFPVKNSIDSKEQNDFSVKARSKFSISLRTLSEPMSLKEMARTWDKCTRLVILDYATQTGGGTFSSKYGGWEKYEKIAAA